MYINWFTRIIFICDPICYTKSVGNENAPDSLNVMVNYHYHCENMVTTRQLPYMVQATLRGYMQLVGRCVQFCRKFQGASWAIILLVITRICETIPRQMTYCPSPYICCNHHALSM